MLRVTSRSLVPSLVLTSALAVKTTSQEVVLPLSEQPSQKSIRFSFSSNQPCPKPRQPDNIALEERQKIQNEVVQEEKYPIVSRQAGQQKQNTEDEIPKKKIMKDLFKSEAFEKEKRKVFSQKRKFSKKQISALSFQAAIQKRYASLNKITYSPKYHFCMFNRQSPLKIENSKSTLAEFEIFLRKGRDMMFNMNGSTILSMIFTRIISARGNQYWLDQNKYPRKGFKRANHIFYPKGASNTVVIHEYRYSQGRNQYDYDLMGECLMSIFYSNVLKEVLQRKKRDNLNIQKVIVRPIILNYDQSKNIVRLESDKDRVFTIEKIQQIVNYIDKDDNRDQLEDCSYIEDVDQFLLMKNDEEEEDDE